MSTPLRVVAFVSALAAAFALAWGGGRLVGPVDTETVAHEGAAAHGDDAEDRARFEEVTGGEGVWMAADLSDPDAAPRLVDEVVSGLGRLDVLVNNAGLTLAKPALEGAGGTFVARGLPAATYEAGQSTRTVVIEFPSVEAAVAAHYSEAYGAALAALDGGAVRDLRIVPGV